MRRHTAYCGESTLIHDDGGHSCRNVPERHTHDYVRNGTTNLYAALDVASGQVIADMSPRHRAEEFLAS